MATDALEMARFSNSLADSIETIRQLQDREYLSTLYSADQVDQWMEETRRFVQTHPLDELLASESNVPDQVASFLAHVSTIIKTPRIIEVAGTIGSGGYGQVFRGKFREYNTTTDVALKKAAHSPNSKVRAKSEKAFEEEARNLKEFAHLFVVKFFGVCQFKDHKYIVMDLCAGSLAGYVRSKSRDLVVANSRMILGQVALAINYLHGQNMIHKDLKPENILYKETSCGWPHILLCDFGNTRQLRHPLVDLLAAYESDRQPSEDGTDAVAFQKTVDKGTAGYIAPELLETSVASFKSDVWAMGAVVFFVVSGGQHPYEFVQIDHQNKLNNFVKKLRCPPNVSQLEDVNAADLICRLMKFDENSRPDASVVLTHPFFWATDPSARTHFVVKVNDFFTSNRHGTELASKLSESLNEEKLRAWYDTLDDQLKTDEIPKNVENLQLLMKGVDLGQVIAFTVHHKVKQQLNADLSSGARIKEMKEPLVTDLLRLLDTAPVLFGLFIWHTVSQLLTKSTSHKFFTDSELTFALFHCPVEFYKHLAQVSTWSLQLAEEQLNMAATLSTPDALRYLLSDQCAGREYINQIIERFKSENGVQNPLHVAAYCSGSEQIIETLIEALGDVDQVTDEKWTALHHAASHNADHQIVAKLLQFNADVHVRDDEDWTPLHHAARYNTNQEITRLLMERGADVKATTNRKWTPLHLAAHYNSNEQIVRLLIDGGADVDGRCDKGWTALHHACRSNPNDQVTSLLLSEGCDVNALTARRWTPLHHAAQGSTNPKIVRLLLRYGAEMEAEDDIGWTALHHAARCCTQVEITRILIEEKANVEAVAKDRTTPLHQAAGFNSNPQVIRLLMEHKAAVNARTTKGATPLHLAASNNPNTEIVDQLMDETNVNATDSEQMTPLHAAAMNNSNADIVGCLLARGADVHAVDGDGWTPLHYAVNRVNFDAVSTLIREGADVNATTDAGTTALHLLISARSHLFLDLNDDPLKEVEVEAVQQAIQQDARHVQDKIKILSLFIEKQANVNAADSTDQWTALHRAAVYSADLDLVRRLVEAGADVNAVDNERCTVLHYAAKGTAISETIRRLAAKGIEISQLCPDAPNYSQADLVDYLLANGARVDEVDVNGFTALHHAALCNFDPAIIDLLLKNGADVNARTSNHVTPIRGSCQTDEANWTPLHLAARYNSNADVISLLITAGADVNAQTSKGETPLKFATRQQFPDAKVLLLSVGAQLAVDESDANERLAALWLASTEN